MVYAPGTAETDPKKQNRALQANAAAVATNTTDIATANTNIATNTANIATNTTNISTNTTNIATNTTNIATAAAKLAKFVLVTDFPGVDPTGVTDSTTGMQAAHNTGKIVYYPAGSYVFTTISFSAGGIVGDGFLSLLFSTNVTTADLITYTGTGIAGQVPTFEDFILETIGGKSSGAGIRFTPSSATLSLVKMDGVSVFGLPISLDMLNVDTYKVTNCNFLNYATAGIRINNTVNPDDGDGQISGSNINTGTGTGAGVLWQAGGGVRFYGNKINGGQIGFSVATTFNGSSADINIVGNSIENVSTSGISLARASGTGTTIGINIGCNQIGITPAPIVVDSSGAFSQMAISGNLIATNGANSSVGINIVNASNFSVVGNTIISNGGTTTTGIITGASSSTAKVGGNLITGFTTAQTLSGTGISTTF